MGTMFIPSRYFNVLTLEKGACGLVGESVGRLGPTGDAYIPSGSSS